ncbi:MAG: diaminopimelate decarboxylase [Bacteroidota bacterium]
MVKREIFMIPSFDFETLAQKYGLPIYVYDTSIMESQLNRLKKAFSVKTLHIHYACKALNNIAVLQWMKNSGTGLDTVSIEEVKLGLFAGFEPGEIMFTPNCVSLSEILEGVQLGVKINIDNLSILEQFGHVKPDYPVCIRINPHIMAGGNLKTSVGHIDSKFGISIHQIPLLKRILENTGQRVEGIHMHTGSDILDADVFLSGAEILLDLAMDFPHLEFVDFGSGFKVPYKPGDIETDVEELGKKISKRFNEFCKKMGKDIALVFEPGKYLVSAAGYFLAQVNVIKQTTSTVFAGLDSGLNHLIRPMFYDAYHHIVNLSNPNGKKRIYTVVGYICETDTFGANRSIAEIREGDTLCFMNAGAYGFTMASNYNSRFRPAEILIHHGKDYLIRERENFDDLVRKQIQPDFLNN